MPTQLVIPGTFTCDACGGKGSTFECGTDAGYYQCGPCHGTGVIEVGARVTDFPTFLANYQREYRRWEATMQEHPKIIQHYWREGPDSGPLSLIQRGPEDYPEGLKVLPTDLQGQLLALAEHLFEDADQRDGFYRFVYPVRVLTDRIKQAIYDQKLSASWMWT